MTRPVKTPIAEMRADIAYKVAAAKGCLDAGDFQGAAGLATEAGQLSRAITICEMHDSGISQTAIATELGCTQSWVSQVLRVHGRGHWRRGQ